MEKRDLRAFENYYEEWSGSVFRYLIHYVGSKSVAEDLFQETWMKALENRGQLRGEERFGPWILRIARNEALNHLRRRRNRVQVWILSNLPPEEDWKTEDLVTRHPTKEPDPRECAQTSERREILDKVMGELDFPSQEMLQLRYFQGLTLLEVSEVLGVPLGTVCTKIHRALRQIREELRRKGFRGLFEM